VTGGHRSLTFAARCEATFGAANVRERWIRRYAGSSWWLPAAVDSTLVARAETLAVDVECSGDALCVTLSDGRVVSVPLVWFPRLAGASTREQSEWELIGGGIGIHWEAMDEDISVASLLRPENFMRLPDKALQPAARKRRAPAERQSR
jgi:hypothetical protein